MFPGRPATQPANGCETRSRGREVSYDFMARTKRSGYLNVGDRIYYGKFKNALARILSFGVNEKGDPTVEAQPINKDGTNKKGKPKTLTLLKVRKVQAVSVAERVASRYLSDRGPR